MMTNDSTPVPSRLGLSRPQIYGLAAAWLGYFLEGFDFSLMIFVVTDVAREFHLSLAVASTLVGAAFTTRWFAGPIIGSISDRYGRRGAMIASACLYSVGTGACGIAWSYGSLFVFRAIVGIGMAGEYSSSAAYVVEISPQRMRNTSSALLLSFFALGSAAAAQVYPLIVPAFGWRALMFVGLAPVLLTLFILFLAPESELWERSRTAARAHPPSGVQIFSRSWWPVTLILCVAVLAFYLASMPAMILLPTYLKGIGYTPVQVGAIHSLGALGMGIGALGAGIVADRLGTARVICWSLFLSMVMVAPVFLLSKTSVPLTGAMMFVLMMLSLGIGGIMPKWIVEHYPVALRGAGLGTVYNVGAFGGFLGPTIAAFFSERFGLAESIVSTAIAFVVLTIIIVALDLPARFAGSAGGTTIPA
jgi:SHS family sialic acid transporter-like MFS transporter